MGWALRALERTETDISERALGAFLDDVGIVERVCESKESHAEMEDGSEVRRSSRDRRVA